MLSPWKKIYDKPRQYIQKQRHYFANKGLYSQSYGFSSCPVWMWELDNKKGWMLKNWCLQTMVMEKPLLSPLDCKEIKPVNPKRNQSWVFFGRNDAKAETSTLATWCEELTHWKRPWCWEGLGAGGEGMTEREMAGWHHGLDWREWVNCVMQQKWTETVSSQHTGCKQWQDHCLVGVEECFVYYN